MTKSNAFPGFFAAHGFIEEEQIWDILWMFSSQIIGYLQILRQNALLDKIHFIILWVENSIDMF